MATKESYDDDSQPPPPTFSHKLRIVGLCPNECPCCRVWSWLSFGFIEHSGDTSVCPLYLHHPKLI